MIAEVIPLKRLPRAISFFDYNVEADLAQKIKVGQLVKISFRKSEIFGLVLRLKNEDDPKLKNVTSIVNQEPIVTENFINYLKELSQIYATSLPTLAQMSLLPLQKNKLKKVEFKQIIGQESPPKGDKKEKFFIVKNPDEQKQVIQTLLEKNKKTIFVVPEVYLIDEVKKNLSIEKQKETVVWHSALSTKQKFERWLEIRNEEKNIIIGTRGTLLLPIFHFDQIVILFEGDNNHKHWDQNPRFHTKDLAKLIAKKANLETVFVSHSPSSEAYFDIHKNGLDTNTTKLPPLEKIELLNMLYEKKAGHYGVLADQAKEAIKNATGDIFLYINKLGFSSIVHCASCSFVNTCHKCNQPLIYHAKQNVFACNYCRIKITANFTCPRCKDKFVELRGVGTEFIEEGVKNLLGKDCPYEIIRIDSSIEEDLPYTKKPRIIIGTQMAKRHVRWDKTDLVILINPDMELNIPEFQAAESLWQTLGEFDFRTRDNSKIFVQTHNPNHLVFRSLIEPDRFYRTELNYRMKTFYPPYSYLVRYFYGNPDKLIAKNEAERVAKDLKAALTKTNFAAKISLPVEMQPKFYRKQFWYVITVKLEKKDWQKQLIALNKIIPANWKVDPNPISILNP